MNAEPRDLRRMTADVVAAYVGNNAVPADELPDFIRTVYRSLVDLERQVPMPAKAVLKPAVPARQSVRKTHIVCLEDGKKLKVLKRHLRAAHNTTPAAYRARWGLRDDYPMVAPAYAAKRSELAKESGLGQRPKRTRTPRRRAA